MAEITMSLPEYQELTSQRDDARREAAELRDQLRKAEMRDPEGRIPNLVLGMEAALSVIKFAVGNLAPETVRGWPYPDLLTFVDALEKLPGVGTETKEYALEFRNFVREARQIERERQARDEQLSA